MLELADAPRSARGGWTSLALVTLAAAALLFALQASCDGLYGYDAYFHIRYAQVLRAEGFSRSFPWWQETFLRDHFADKDFLYHVLLIPFTFGDLVTGAKVAAALFGAGLIGAFHEVCRKLRVPMPALWSLALLGSSMDFIYRIDAMRPLALAGALALCGTCAILLGNRRWAFAIAAIYPSAHISFHLLPCVALLHDAATPGGDGSKRSFSLSRWTLGGAAAGALLSPYVPNNLYLWWVQNVRVLGLAWGGATDLRLGADLLPRSSADLLRLSAGVFVALLLGILLMIRGRGRASRESLTLFLISAGFLGLTMLSRRFIEFWAPFTLLLLGVAVRDDLTGGGPGEPRESRWPSPRGLEGGLLRPVRPIVTLVSSLAVAGLLAANLWTARRQIAADPGPTYSEASSWMAANIPKGETIFHLDWDDFPQLFFFNPQFRYLVGLDPTFMYVTDASRWKLWSDIAHADVDDVYTPIRTTFGCKWVFAIPEGEDFLKAARRDPRFFMKYSDPSSTVLFLADGYSFVAGWRVRGWYPNPGRRFFDVPLPGEPGASNGERDAEGPASTGLDTTSPAGFVDLARLLRMPPTVDDACGITATTLTSDEARAATLAVTSDDEIRVYLNAEEVLASSPYGNPNSREPESRTESLDEALESRARVPERSATVRLKPGANFVVVKDCRVGEDFGFYFRVFGGDGSPVR